MANEILISSLTGLTVTVNLYIGTVSVGSPITAIEISGTGEYIANIPLGLDFGRYTAIAMVGNSIKIGSGEILWDGNYEVEMALGMLEGLDINNPMTVIPSQRISGNILLGLTGDGETSTTVTRL